MPKTCEKRFYKHIESALCKKRPEKKANIGKIGAFRKFTKNGHNTKAIVHAKYSVWVNK